jgi:hypothetical protein
MPIRIRLVTLMLIPDADPNSDFLFEVDPGADPDPTFQPDADPDPDPSFKKSLKPLLKC